MRHHIHLRREVSGGPSRRRLTAAAVAALEAARVQPCELTVVLTDSRRIRRLNARFAGQDHVTDVLAFPAEPHRVGARPLYLGDVVISLPRARAQARHRRVLLLDEIALLTIHGTLHLLGCDHARPVERRRMWRLQSDALRRLGLDPEPLQVSA